MLRRRTVVARGPRFFDGETETMFEQVLDGSTSIGPRPATDADIAAHPAAYEAYLEGADGVPAEAVMRPPVTYVEPPDGAPEPSAPRRRGRRSVALDADGPLS